MDIIDNYDKLSLGKYQEIKNLCEGRVVDDEIQTKILAILTDKTEDEIDHLPIVECREMAHRTGFLYDAKVNVHPLAKTYLVGDFKVSLVRDFRKIETGQYIDFQTYAQDVEHRLVELLSVILVPKGHRYNEGYDLAELQEAIRHDLSVADAFSVLGFFLLSCGQSIVSSLSYSKEMAKGVKDKTEREKILKKIMAVEMFIKISGVGFRA